MGCMATLAIITHLVAFRSPLHTQGISQHTQGSSLSSCHRNLPALPWRTWVRSSSWNHCKMTTTLDQGSPSPGRSVSLRQPHLSPTDACGKDMSCQDDIPEKLSKAEVREAQCLVGYLVASMNLRTFSRIIHILKASFTLGWNNSIAACNEMFSHPNWHLNLRLLYQVGPYVCSLGLFSRMFLYCPMVKLHVSKRESLHSGILGCLSFRRGHSGFSFSLSQANKLINYLCTFQPSCDRLCIFKNCFIT